MVHQHFVLVDPVHGHRERDPRATRAGRILDMDAAHERVADARGDVRLPGPAERRRRRPVCRRGAACRDPEGAVPGRRRADPRRADRGAHAGGDAGAVREPPPAARGRQDDRVHQPQARRGPRRSPTASRCCGVAASSARRPPPETTKAKLAEMMVGRPVLFRLEKPQRGDRRAGPASSTGSWAEGKLNGIEPRGPRRRDPRHRRRGGQRPAGAGRGDHRAAPGLGRHVELAGREITGMPVRGDPQRRGRRTSPRTATSRASCST